MEDEFFLEWQKCMVEVSQIFRRLEKKLKADMMPVWSLAGSVLYLMYNIDEPFEPQFQEHIGQVCQLLRELAQEGCK